MDTTGKNRFQLLCMDEEAGTPAPSEFLTDIDLLKKKPKSSSVQKKNFVEEKSKPVKENKSVSASKNENGSKIKIGKPKSIALASIKNIVGANSVRGDILKFENNENSGQKNQNFRSGGSTADGKEFNDERVRQAKEFRDRENRGPPRYRNSEGGFRNGKREFDRQSGSDKTGVKPIDKRDGAGAHNWGSAKQYIDDINNSNIDTDIGLTDKEESANEQNIEHAVIPEEDEIKVLTLDEWKALRQTRTKPQYNIRKAGEGEDTAQWKKMVVLNKKKDDENEEELEYDPSMYPQRVGRLQRIVDIQFNFNDNRRNGFGRGRGRSVRLGVDRSRFEDGRSGMVAGVGDRSFVRPRNFGGKQAQSGQISLKVDDERQFPTLS